MRTNPSELVLYDPDIRYTPAEIKALRRRENLTVSDLARIVGAHRQSVTYWEAGEKTPNRPYVILLRLLDLYPELFIVRHSKH